MNFYRHHTAPSLTKILISLSIWLGLIIWSSCDRTPENILHQNNYDSLDLAPFVEPDFPFITTSVDLRGLSAHLPHDNVVSRGIVVMVDDNTYACFDTDLLRWAVGWTGDFISLTGMAQISYDDFFNKNNKFPQVLGDPNWATGLYPGWETKNITREDPREKNPPDRNYAWGPIPESQGRFGGLYPQDDGVLLEYRIGEALIREKIASENFEGGTIFIRNLHINPEKSENLYLHLAEVTDGVETVSEENFSYVIHGENQDLITAVGRIDPTGTADILADDHRFLSASFSEIVSPTEAALVIWQGSADHLPEFQSKMENLSFQTPDPDAASSGKRWEEKVYTAEIRSPDTAAYVTDQLVLPLPNPWNRNIRLADIDFFPDGTALAVSYEGDVWRIDGIGKKYLTWSRFASGFNEPMSIKIFRDSIYVFDRMGITRLHDRNGNGEADYHENFSNIMHQSMQTREWPASLEVDPRGGFYIAKGGSLSAGPAIGKSTYQGFRMGSEMDGSVLWISPDGRRLERIATGFRGPFLGVHPVTGMVTSSDQEGNYVPSTPVYHIQKGDYFGVPSTAHGADTSNITPPLTWIPHHIDPSGMGQFWAMTDQMGSLNNQLLHSSFSRPGLLKVSIDSTETPWQGGTSFIRAHYPAPVSKGAVHPVDGQVYVTGFNLWGSHSEGVSALTRLRYTGKKAPYPISFSAGQQGIVLDFEVELDHEIATDIGRYQVIRYNYLRSPDYGSGHYRMDGTPGEEQLPVLSAHLSEDGKRLFLNIPNMEPVEQMEIHYDLLTLNGDKIKDQFWFTLHRTTPLDLEALRLGHIDEQELVLSKEITDEEIVQDEVITVERGEELFLSMACAGCHSPGTRTEGMYGPPFQDLYGSMQEFENSDPQLADEEYLRESILDPGKLIVKGYDPEMPSYLGILNDAEVESMVLYIKSLSSKELLQ